MDTEYQWDKVMGYHSFKCTDFSKVNSTESSLDDVDIVVRDYDVNGVEDGDGEDVERNDVNDYMTDGV